MRNSAGNFDREAEPGRYGHRPAPVRCGLVRPVKRGINLNSREAPSVALEVAAFGRKESCSLAGNTPSRAANIDWPIQNLASIVATCGRSAAYRYTYHKEGGMLNLGIVELAVLGGLF